MKKSEKIIGEKISRLSIALKARAICDDTKNLVEPHEYEMAKLFTYNPDGLMDDEFTINLIQRVYGRIQTNESNEKIIATIQKWAIENEINLAAVVNAMNNEWSE